MRVYYVPCGESTIDLGRAGENLAQKIVFNVSDWARLFGPGNVSLIVCRPNDQQPYPVEVTSDMESGEVWWVVSDSDTAKAGWGRVELLYLVDDAVVKSRTWQTYVSKSLSGPNPTDPSVDPWAAYVAAVIKAAIDAKDAAQKAQEALGHQPKIENDTWWVWDPEARDYVDTGVPAQGPKGDLGEMGLSAYQQAVAGGFTGTEEEFEGLLAQLKDGPFLPLDGGGKIQSTSSESAALINGDEVAVGTPNGDLGLVAPNFIGVMDSKRLRGAIFKEVEDGMLVGCADETPISIVNLAEPVRDDAAATKKYVDTLGRNTVKQTGELYQNVDGSLSFNPDSRGVPPSLMLNPGDDGRGAELRAGYLYFDQWTNDGIRDFALTIAPRSRDTGTIWTPVLEFEDAYIGAPGVILAGVNTPTEDHDAANKKYVDSSFLGLGGGSLSDDYYKINILFPEDETFSNPLEVWNQDASGNKDMVSLGYASIMFHRILGGKKQWSVIDGSGADFIQVYKLDENGTDTPIMIRGVDTPKVDTDAANKKYVDESIAAVVGDISALLDAINGEVV